jgi:phage FluMu protein Com
MLLSIKKCEGCGQEFTFESSQCGQIILKQGEVEATILFLPKCPSCKQQNTLEMQWDEYDTIDY